MVKARRGLTAATRGQALSTFPPGEGEMAPSSSPRGAHYLILGDLRKPLAPSSGGRRRVRRLRREPSSLRESSFPRLQLKPTRPRERRRPLPSAYLSYPGRPPENIGRSAPEVQRFRPPYTSAINRGIAREAQGPTCRAEQSATGTGPHVIGQFLPAAILTSTVAGTESRILTRGTAPRSGSRRFSLGALSRHRFPKNETCDYRPTQGPHK